ncbi:MAG: hypothetical protein OEU86_05320 [Gammaproteobacteria bacterium]|nr:hypothetical protein [Gammaproteobacteria bacterium]
MKRHPYDDDYLPADELFPFAIKRKLDREKRRRLYKLKTPKSFRRPDIHE